MRKLMKRKIVEQQGICPICNEEFTDYGDVAPDHKNPKGMGGAWRDDHPSNVQATHYWCNGEKRSTRWTTSGRSGIFLADLIHLVKVADDDALLPSSSRREFEC